MADEGGTNYQRIELIYVDTQAQAEAKKWQASEVARTKSVAQEAKKAAKDVADELKRLAKETADAQKKVDAESKAARRAAERAMTAEERKEAAERLRNQRTMDRFALQDYRDRVAAQIKEAKRLAAEEVRSAEAAAAAKRKAAEEAEKAWKAQDASVMGAVKSVGMFAAGMAGLSSATSVLTDVLERFNAIRVAGLKASADILDEAGDLRKLGALTGEMGRPSEQLIQQLNFRTLTLQSAHDAREMTTEARASGFGAISAGLVSDQDFSKHLETAGMLATMTDSAPGAVGKMSGILPMITGKKKNTTDDLNVMMERLYEEQKLGGFKDYGESATQFAQASEYVMKGVYTAPTAQALLSAFAMAGQGATAAERLSQVTTATSMGLIRNKGMKAMPEYEPDIMRSGEYFKSLGVTANTKPEDRIMSVVKDLMSAEDVSNAKGLNWDPMLYLGEKGFINVQSREALAKLAGVERQGGQLSSILKLGASPLPATSGIAGRFRDMKQNEPWAMREEGRIQARLAEYHAGMAGGMGPFRDLMREKAFGTLGGKTAYGEDLDAIKGRAWWDPKELVTQRLAGLDIESQHQVFAAAKKVGVQTPNVGMIGRDGRVLGELQLGWDELFGIAQKTRAAGGSLGGGVDAALTNRLLTEIRDGLKALVPPGAPNPVANKAPAVLPPAAPGPVGRGVQRGP